MLQLRSVRQVLKNSFLLIIFCTWLFFYLYLKVSLCKIGSSKLIFAPRLKTRLSCLWKLSPQYQECPNNRMGKESRRRMYRLCHHLTTRQIHQESNDRQSPNLDGLK